MEPPYATVACEQVFGQILFSGSLFLFWLVYADGMSSRKERHFSSFFVPKLLLVCTYVGVATTMFVLHGRLPDRVNVADVRAEHSALTEPDDSER